MKTNHGILFSVLKWVILLDFLLSMHIWLEAYIPSLFLNLATILLLFLLVKRYHLKDNKGVVKKILIWTVLYGIYLLVTGNIRYAFSQPFYYLPGILMCMLPKLYLEDLLSFVSKSLAIILSAGFIIYVVDLIVDIPPVGAVKIGDYYEFENYIFLIKSQSLRELFRFNGPFAESGHMSMICALLLYANKYNLKNWYNIVFLVSILFSLSLAGYVLLGFGMVLYYLKSIKSLLFIVLGSLIISYIITNVWDNGNNPVNELIFSRLEYDEDKGISGNNRFDLDTERYYNNLTTQEFLTGLGLTRYNYLVEQEVVAGAGYKIFILINGLIGCVFVLLIYFCFSLLTNNRRYAIGFLLLMIATFIQRSYPTWMAWLLPFICGMVSSNILHKNYFKNKTMFL